MEESKSEFSVLKYLGISQKTAAVAAVAASSARSCRLNMVPTRVHYTDAGSEKSW